MMYIKNKGKEMFKFTVKKSLNNILEVFNKTSEELTEFIRVTDEENDKLAKQISELKSEYVDNEVDRNKASKTLDKIKNILGE